MDEKGELLKAKYQLAVITIKDHQADRLGFCYCFQCREPDQDIDNYFKWKRLKKQMEKIE